MFFFSPYFQNSSFKQNTRQIYKNPAASASHCPGDGAMKLVTGENVFMHVTIMDKKNPPSPPPMQQP